MGRRNPLRDWPQIFIGGRYPWRNHACQIWWRSLKGFMGDLGEGGLSSAFPIDFAAWSSLQLSHFTVWAWWTTAHRNFVLYPHDVCRSALLAHNENTTLNKITKVVNCSYSYNHLQSAINAYNWLIKYLHTLLPTEFTTTEICNKPGTHTEFQNS